MHEFLYDYVKPKYDEKAKFCYIDTDSFIVYIKTDDNYEDITENVESRFDTSNYELYWPLPKEKNKKLIGLMKDELCGKVMTKFVGLRVKLIVTQQMTVGKIKKLKSQKVHFLIKRKLKFENYKNCLEATQLEDKISHLEKKQN